MATIPNQTHPSTHSIQHFDPPFASRAPGLAFDRHFTKPGVSPFDEITWELRDAVIQDFKGKIIFEQKNVEVPADWSHDRHQHRRHQIPPRPASAPPSASPASAP